MTSLYHHRPFNLRYAVWQHGRYTPELLQTHRTAKASALYIQRRHGIDDIGPTPDWSRRDDLVATGRCSPARGDDPAIAGLELWMQADRHARQLRPTEPACAHAVGSLPIGNNVTEWRNLIEGFCEDHLTAQGMIVDWAIHQRDPLEAAPEILPHVHMLITTRVFDRDHPELGRIRQTWLRTEGARKRMAERWWAHSGIYPVGYGNTGVAFA